MDYPCAKFGDFTFSHFGFISLNTFFCIFDLVTLTYDLLSYNIH